MVLDFLDSILGTCPEGFEIIRYVIAGAFALFVIGEVFYGISLLIKRVTEL